MPTSKYIKTAKEQYFPLKRWDHYGCLAIKKRWISPNEVEVYMLKCTHLKENRVINITKDDL